LQARKSSKVLGEEMKVLIINAFADNVRGRRSFQEFLANVKNAFVRQRELSIQSIDFIVRDRNNLEDYLYDVYNKYENKEAEKGFDNLDFIFVDGEANLLPWLPQAHKLRILVRMCAITRKCLFASTFAMQMLIYYCATGFPDITVFNGKGKGGNLREIYNVAPEKVYRLKKNEVFLDNASGDLYKFQPGTNEWKPIANTGLHHHSATVTFENHALVKQTQTYKPKGHREIYTNFTGKNNEGFCHVKKQMLQHWAMKGLKFHEFLVGRQNAWDVHPFNASHPDLVFTVLADGDYGPQVLSMDNIVATQFHTTAKHPETIILLDNFVSRKLKEMHAGARLDRRLNNAIEPRTSALGYANSMLPEDNLEVSEASTKKSIKFNHLFTHSGYTYSHREAAVVLADNNATTDHKISIEEVKRATLSRSMMHKYARPLNMSSSVPHLTPINPLKHTSTYPTSPLLSPAGTLQNINSTPRSHTRLLEHDQYSPNEAIATTHSTEEQAETITWHSKAEIRSLLHPTLDKRHLPKKDDWIPGYNNKPQLMLNPVRRVKHQSKPFCRYQEFRGLSMDGSSGDVGFRSIRNSTTYDEEKKEMRRRDLEERDKWLVGKDFRVTTSRFGRSLMSSTASGGSGFMSEQRDFPTLGPGGRDPWKHQFRVEDKKKWVSGRFKTAGQ